MEEPGYQFGVVGWRARPCGKEISIGKKRVEAAQSQSGKDAAGERATFIAGNQNVGAGGAFRIKKVAVLLHDELSAQWDHEADAKASSDQRQHEDAELFQWESKKDERRQGKDDAAGHRFTGRSGRLHDVIFQNAGLAQRAKNADGQAPR